MLTKRLLLVVFCSLVFPICPLLYGQASGSFSGTVSDKTGSVVSGATVRVTSQGTAITREATTDASGHYVIPLLPVADFTIRVESQGFGAVEQKDVRLQVDEHRELNFTLAPASVTEKVEVSATAVAVEASNPTLGQVITSEQVAGLPLNGRDFVQLATLTPGTTQETSPQSFFNGGASSEVSARGTYSLSVGGSRAQSTDWLIDGNDNNELTAGGIAILPSIDAIQEFKVLTFNYSAEYGTRAGPTVLINTKSGSNQLHGSLFEFFRNTKLDATGFFAATKEKFNLNQFGGSLGGALQKDKTFFFVDYQGDRQRHGIPFVGVIPTPAMKTGDYTLDPFGVPRGGSNPNGFGNLSNPFNSFGPFLCDAAGNPSPAPGGVQSSGIPCNKIPASMIDPTGQTMMNFYPTSNASNAAGGYNYTNVPIRKFRDDEFDVRLDHNFSSKDSAFARFSYDQATTFQPGGSPGLAEQGAFASTVTFTNHGRNLAISETHVFSDRTINQFNTGFNRIFNHITSIADSSCESAKIGIQGANVGSKCDSITGYPASLNQSTKDCISCGLTSTQVANYWSLGDRGYTPFQGGTNIYSFSDSIDMIRGKHDIRVGGQIRLQQMNVRTNAFQDGFLIPFGVSGDASADLLMGTIGLGIHDQTFNGATTGRRWKMFRPFVQDDWRVTKDLTVNIGLAWALVTPIVESENRQSDFDAKTGRLLVAGNASIAGCTICVRSDAQAGIQLDKSALEPRIGLAWKPMGSQTTAIRAGYAIFHDSSWNQGAQGLWQNPPYLAESDNFNGLPTCPIGNTTINCGIQRVFLAANLQPIMTPPNPDTFPGTVLAQNLNFKQGMIQQYNLNVERQVPGNVVLTVGYAGSYSTHILVSGMNLNIHSPNACPGGSAPVAGYAFGCGYVAPTSPFGVVSAVEDVGRARYNSLQVKAETKSTRHGLYALFGYTYSRTFDSGFPDGLGTLPGATIWPLPGAQKADWSLSQLNLNQSFVASVLYDLPFGKGKTFGSNWSGPVNAILGNWETDVIEKATTGFPLYLVDGNNLSGSNFLFNGAFSLNRPNQVGDPNQPGPVAGNPGCKNPPAKVHTLASWFNPCAFVSAPAGELGDAGRAPVYGPHFVNTDFSAIKHFRIRESMGLDFRAEFFNLFNHAELGLSGDSSTQMQNLASPSTFAKVNQKVHDPREIQFGLKLLF
jgi:hypothetical protein